MVDDMEINFRRTIQICANEDGLYALCDDNTLWRRKWMFTKPSDLTNDDGYWAWEEISAP